MAEASNGIVHRYSVLYPHPVYGYPICSDYCVDVIRNNNGDFGFRIMTGFFANNEVRGAETYTKTYKISKDAYDEIMKKQKQNKEKNIPMSGNDVLDIVCGKDLYVVEIPNDEKQTKELLFVNPENKAEIEDVKIIRNFHMGYCMPGYHTSYLSGMKVKKYSSFCGEKTNRINPETQEICGISYLGKMKNFGLEYSLAIHDKSKESISYTFFSPHYVNADKGFTFYAHDEDFSTVRRDNDTATFTKIIEDDGEMSFVVTGNVSYRGYENLKLEITAKPAVNGTQPIQCLPFFDDNNITWDNDQFRLLLQKGNRAISYTGTSKNGNLDSSLKINISRSLSVKDYFDTRRKCLKLEKVRETVKREKERLKRLLKYVTPQKGASNLNVRYNAKGSNLFIGDFNTADYKGNNFLLVKNENGGLTVSDQAINPIGEYQLLDSGDVIVQQADDTYVVLNEDASKTKAKGRLQRDGSIDITIIGENEYNYQFTGTLSCLKGTIETAGSIGHCSLSVSNVKTPDALLSVLQQTVIDWRGTPALEGKKLIYRNKQTKDLEQ